MIGNSPGVSGFAGIAKGTIIISDLEHEWFLRGESYSHTDYYTFAIDETKNFVFDPTACSCAQLYIQGIQYSATSGPITIDVYAGTTANSDGTLLISTNRKLSGSTPDTEFRLNPTGLTLGTRFAGDLVAANEGGGALANQGGETTGGLLFEIDKTSKYTLSITNLNGAATYLKLNVLWFEVTTPVP